MRAPAHMFHPCTVALAQDLVKRSLTCPEFRETVKSRTLKNNMRGIWRVMPVYIQFRRVLKQDVAYFTTLLAYLAYTYSYPTLRGVVPGLPKPEEVKIVHTVVDGLATSPERFIADATAGVICLTVDSPDTVTPPISNTGTTDMTTLAKYQNTPFATVKLIHGRPVEDLTEDDLVALIRKARKEQDSIKDLVESSRRMREKNGKLQEAIDVYLTALDSLKD